MNYAKIVDGIVVQVGLLSAGSINGCSVSGYDLLPPEVLRVEGWVPLVDEPPEYDPSTQQLLLTGYTIQENQVVALYEIHSKPVEPPTVDQRIETLEMALMDLTLLL